MLKYDDVMNRQREAIYGDRRRILEGGDLQEKVAHFLEDVVKAMVTEATAEGHAEDWDLKQLWTNLKQLYPISITLDEVVEEAGAPRRDHPGAARARDPLRRSPAVRRHARKPSATENMRELERRVVLSVIGRKWQEHLYEMDYLKEGIGLRAMAQRDPLVEYQREGFLMFQTMMESIREESIGMLFNIEVETRPAPEVSLPGVTDARSMTTEPMLNTPGLDAPARPSTLRYTAPEESGEAATHIERTARCRRPRSTAQRKQEEKGQAPLADLQGSNLPPSVPPLDPQGGGTDFLHVPQDHGGLEDQRQDLGDAHPQHPRIGIAASRRDRAAGSRRAACGARA